VLTSTVASLDSLSNPASQSNLAPPITLIRQPLPPPIAAPVQTLQAGLDLHDHSQNQLPLTLVSDPRPGAAQALDGDLSKGPKHLHIVGTYHTVFVAAFWLVLLIFAFAM